MTPEQIAAAGGLYKDCWTVRDEFAARFIEKIPSHVMGEALQNEIFSAFCRADLSLIEREREE